MNDITSVHPDVLLEALLAKAARSNRRSNLTAIHDLCRKQHQAGSRDFSLSTIGHLAEAEGIMRGRALYNAPSADYRALIESWAAYAGPLPPKPPKTLASHEYLMRIEDPAIRSLMHAVIAERDKLRAQLNVLKAHTQVTVDRRPLGAIGPSAPGIPPVAVLALPAHLTPSEREALQKAVSGGYLEERGLKEGSYGEIRNERGRVIFEVGFASAIRKMLGHT